MILIADTHVHVYPHYSTETLLRSAWINLGRLSAGVPGEPQRALFLAERSDCGFYEDLLEGRYALDAVPLESGGCARVAVPLAEEEAGMLIFPGFQIVTKERIEVLALITRERIPDGLDLSDTLRHIMRSNGVPVLPWAFGKRLGHRGILVEQAIEQGKLPLSIGDTSLGSLALCTPVMFSKGKQRSYPLLAGTDPLPIEGEEELVGSYGIVTPPTIDPDRPSSTFREALCAAPGDFSIVGSHSSLWRAARRLYGNERARRRK